MNASASYLAAMRKTRSENQQGDPDWFACPCLQGRLRKKRGQELHLPASRGVLLIATHTTSCRETATAPCRPFPPSTCATAPNLSTKMESLSPASSGASGANVRPGRRTRRPHDDTPDLIQA
jgi:hypothetical protein